MMQIGSNGISLLREFEGFKAHPYLDSTGVPTIGFGTTVYPDGRKVTLKDNPIDVHTAMEYLIYHLQKRVYKYIPAKSLNQNQFDALCSFVYNVGIGNFNTSTLRKKILKNQQDKTIADEFLKWNKERINGKLTPSDGLTRRRKAEAKLYFAPIERGINIP